MRGFLKLSVLMFLGVLVGCKKPEQPVTIVLEGEPKVVADVNDWLNDNPQVAATVLEDEFIIKIIPPDISIDQEMIIRPYPNVDFKIGLIDPYAHGRTPELEEKLAELIRKHIQEKFQKP